MSENKSLESQALNANDSSPKFLGVSLIFHALLVLLVVYLNYPAIKQKLNPQTDAVAVEIKEPTPATQTLTTPAATTAAIDEKAVQSAKTEPVKTETSKIEEKVQPVDKTTSQSQAQAKQVVKVSEKNEKALQKARIKIAEFKDDESLTAASIKVPKKAIAKNESNLPLPQKQTSTQSNTAKSAKSTTQQKVSASKPAEEEAEVLVPKATITEISEVPVNEEGIPLPKISEDSNVMNELADSNSMAESQSMVQSQSQPKLQSQSQVQNQLQNMARTELFEQTVEENSTSTVTEVRGANANLSRPAPTRAQIRAVTALEQRPGNPLPKYSDFERLRRHEGQVTYLAYVTTDGRLTDFILEQSSGYPNLDQKTLGALRNWRFVAGQEGWVEIPQVWILSGEAEQLPSQLRR